MTFRPVVVPVAVVVVVVDVAAIGGAIHILYDGRHGGTSSLAERLQQRRQGWLSGGQSCRQGPADRQKFLARHILVVRVSGGVVLQHQVIKIIMVFRGRTYSQCGFYKLWYDVSSSKTVF